MDRFNCSMFAIYSHLSDMSDMEEILLSCTHWLLSCIEPLALGLFAIFRIELHYFVMKGVIRNFIKKSAVYKCLLLFVIAAPIVVHDPNGKSVKFTFWMWAFILTYGCECDDISRGHREVMCTIASLAAYIQYYDHYWYFLRTIDAMFIYVSAGFVYWYVCLSRIEIPWLRAHYLNRLVSSLR